jgi:glycosyltransferase involved in cell wall biosynthesis
MKNILIVGPDRVMPKLFGFANKINDRGYEYTIYTHDRPPKELEVRIKEDFNVTIKYGPKHKKSIFRFIKDFCLFNNLIRKNKYQIAELYSDYHILASFGYLLILFINRVDIILWCRGELYDWRTFSWWQKFYFWVAFKLSSKIILKEKYMMDIVKSIDLNLLDKTIEFHNSVEIPEVKKKYFQGEVVNILFLNMFKKWRNVSFCIDVALELRNRGIDFKMNIVGEKLNESAGLMEESLILKKNIEKHDLASEVKIFSFATNIKSYYEEADIFILPADLIYCNFSLIEAMSFGLIPIVSNKDVDYQLIIEDGVSGFGLPLSADLWVEKIIKLRSDKEQMKSFSEQARRKIIDQYSIDVMLSRYLSSVGLE